MNIYNETNNIIIHETSVDFILRPCFKEVHIVQFDKTLPVIKVELFKNGEKYIIPDEASINIRFGKLDHTFVMKPVLGCNEERTAIYFDVDEQMTVIAGRVSPVLELIIGSTIAYSSPIGFVIDKNPVQMSDVESATVIYPVIYELIGQVAQFEIRVAALENKIVDIDNLNARVDSLESNVPIWNAKYDKPATGIPASDLAETYVVANEFNIQNGSGTNSVQMKQDITDPDGYFAFSASDNAAAVAYDSSLAGNATYGSIGDYSSSLGGRSQAKGKRSLAQGTRTLAIGNYAHSEGANTVAYGNQSHAEGSQTFALTGAHAEGNRTQAKGDYSHAEGEGSITAGRGSHAEGYHTEANGTASHSEGTGSKASAPIAHVEGTNNYVGVKASSQPSSGSGASSTVPSGYTLSAGESSHAEGFDNFIYGAGSHAEGAQNVINGTNSHAEGIKNTVDSNVDGAHAEGYQTQALGSYSHSQGHNTQAKGMYSFASGDGANANGIGAFAHGRNGTNAHANYSVALGNGLWAANEDMTVVGKYNSNANNSVFIVGIGSDSSNRANAFEVYEDGKVVAGNKLQEKMADATVNFTGRNPNAEELDSTLSATIKTGARGSQSVALNKNTMALGTSSMTNGNKTIAKGDESHAEGYQCVALGNGSHAEGNITVAYGVQSHSEGYETQALGDASHSEGSETISRAYNSHAEGYKTTVQDNYLIVDTGITPDPTPSPEPSPVTPEELDAENGKQSHAEGALTFAFGVESHAEGDSTKTYGMGSHAEGCRTQTGELVKRKTVANKDYYTVNHDKQYQHAEGIETKAIARGTHAEGIGTIANQPYQHVSGKYNNNKANTLFEVGNGTSDSTRGNAFEVYLDGHAEIMTMGTTANSVATRDFVEANSGAGTRLYLHKITGGGLISGANIEIVSLSSEPYTTIYSVCSDLTAMKYSIIRAVLNGPTSLTIIVGAILSQSPVVYGFKRYAPGEIASVTFDTAIAIEDIVNEL